MKVMFLLEYYHPHIGGVETLFKSLTEQLSNQGAEVIVITNRYDNNLPSTEETDGVAIRRYNFINRYVFTFFAWIPALWHIKGVDIIHTTSYNAGLPAWFVAKLSGKRSIITFHEYWGGLWYDLPWINGFSRRLNHLFERMLAKLSFDKIVAVSDSTMQSLKSAGVRQSRLRRIYNGIDYSQFQSHPNVKSDKDVFRFLYFGRVGYSKGLDILIPALSHLSTDTACELVLILPKEPLLVKIKQLIADHNITGDRINMIHSLSYDQLKSHIVNADCVVIPSYSEGFCYAAVETMALGTPIISSGRAALSEVIGGKHITMSQHTSHSLSKCMQEAIEQNWTEKPAKRFPLNDTIDGYLSLYKELI